MAKDESSQVPLDSSADSAPDSQLAEVANYYRRRLPRALMDVFPIGFNTVPNPSDTPEVQKLLRWSAGMKTALEAAYSVGLQDKGDVSSKVQIEDDGPEKAFKLIVRAGKHAGGGTFYVLEGEVSAPAIQAVGAMVDSKLLRSITEPVQVKVSRNADSTEARFTSPEEMLASEINVSERSGGNISLTDQSGYYPTVSEADPEMFKATLALANALEHWVAQPEYVTRTRIN